MFNKSGAALAQGKAIGIYWGEMMTKTAFCQIIECDNSYAVEVTSLLPGDCEDCIIDASQWRSSIALANDPRSDPLGERGEIDFDAFVEEPNVIAEEFVVSGMPVVVFVTATVVPDNAEILYDYGSGYWEQCRRDRDHEQQVVRLQRALKRKWDSEGDVRAENEELRKELAGLERAGVGQGDYAREVHLLRERVASLEHQVRHGKERSVARQKKLLASDLKQAETGDKMASPVKAVR